MADDDVTSADWLERALKDPAAVFSGPEAVAESPDLTLEQKLTVLRSWRYDALELSVAEEEGMQGASSGLLPRILQTLHELSGGAEGEPAAPTKQHGPG